MATKAAYFTIANGATTSDALDMGANPDPLGGLAGFMIPASFTGTAITFSVSNDDSTYAALYNSNTQLSITVSTSRAFGFTADQRSLLSAWRYVKLVSGSAEGGARQITAIIK